MGSMRSALLRDTRHRDVSSQSNFVSVHKRRRLCGAVKRNAAETRLVDVVSDRARSTAVPLGWPGARAEAGGTGESLRARVVAGFFRTRGIFSRIAVEIARDPGDL